MHVLLTMATNRHAQICAKKANREDMMKKKKEVNSWQSNDQITGI